MADKLVVLAYEVISELQRAEKLFPRFNSLHEGWAVLMEEVDELWDHVKTNQKKRNPEEIRKECIQIAAMALRIIQDCGEDDYRK